jgi:hypothetical protein
VLFAFGLGFGVAFPLFSDLDFFCVLQLCLLLHHLCHYLLVAGWGISHRLGELHFMTDA